ncbi:MAG: hypothetical protein F4206_13390 [Gammaproteobacteria bacterium]|nr:hypothetical protein [Gammaproteobacteria bacterium]
MLLFLGPTIGILTFLISAGLYIFDQSGRIYENIFGKDVLIIGSLLENDDAVVFNKGYRGINLLRLEIHHSEFQNHAMYDIYKPLPRENYLRFSVGEEKKHYLVPTKSAIFKKHTERLKELAKNNVENRVYPVATTRDDPHYKFRKKRYEENKNNGPWPDEYPCEAKLHYVPFGEKEEVTKMFSCTSMIYSKIPLLDLHKFLESNCY